MKRFFVVILATIFPVAAMQQRDPRMALSFVLNAVVSTACALPEKTPQINCVQREHYIDKRFRCKYSGCSYVAKKLSSLLAHEIIHVGEKKTIDTTYMRRTRIQCVYCDYSTRYYGDMTRHIRTHTGERPYKCEMCDFAAAQKSSLMRHMRAKHSEKALQ